MNIQSIQSHFTKTSIYQPENIKKVNSPVIKSSIEKTTDKTITSDKQMVREMKLNSAYKTIGLGNFLNISA
jgi:hypothetical protein